MKIDPKVIFFCQKEIMNSGLVLDEDLALLQLIEYKQPKAGVNVTQGLIVLGTAIGTAYYTLKWRDVGKSIRMGIIFSLPAASSLLLSLYHRRKADNQMNLMTQLLSELRRLSLAHSEVFDFIKQFNYAMETSTDHLLKLSEETICDLSKHTCDIQSVITKHMQEVIKEIHVGLQDISLDLTGFEEATGLPLKHDDVSKCLQNTYFIEGQVILLRSHLLASVFLVASSRGNLAIFAKVLDKSIPPLLFLVEHGVERIRHKLNDVRYPNNPPPLISLSKLENIVENRKFVCVPRLKKHIIKINDGICCTLTKLRRLMVTLENVESESQTVLLQETVASVTTELLKCCQSTADLEKLIQLLNCNQKIKKLDLSSITELGEEDCATASTVEQMSSERDEPGIDSDYQVFGNYSSDSEDDNERHAVRFYKRRINSNVDWLAELRQSDEFQKRQSKFHTAKPVTSSPIEPLIPAVEPIKSTSFQVSSEIPRAPPLPSSVFSPDISGIMRHPQQSGSNYDSISSSYAPGREGDIQKVPTLTQYSTTENSSLLNSLKSILDEMGQQEEDQFE